jgi:hypothetical protein
LKVSTELRALLVLGAQFDRRRPSAPSEKRTVGADGEPEILVMPERPGKKGDLGLLLESLEQIYGVKIADPRTMIDIVPAEVGERKLTQP